MRKIVKKRAAAMRIHPPAKPVAAVERNVSPIVDVLKIRR